MNLDNYIRKVPDWPKKGVVFYDITTAIEKPSVFKYIIDKLTEPFVGQQIDKVVGIDARGFLFAAAIAYKIGAGVCLVRKKGKLPYKTIARDYILEYASNTIEMHSDTIKPNEKVLLVDDLVATGGTIKAAIEIIEEMGGKIEGIGFVVDLPFLGGSDKIKQYKTHYLMSYNNEEIKI